MNLQPMLVESLSQATAQVFSTMLGVEIARGEVTAEDGTQEANDGVVSFIGVAGEWAGTGSLSCSPALACRICAAMLTALRRYADVRSHGRQRGSAGRGRRVDQHDYRERQDRYGNAPGSARPEHSDGGLRAKLQDQERRQQ